MASEDELFNALRYETLSFLRMRKMTTDAVVAWLADHDFIERTVTQHPDGGRFDYHKVLKPFRFKEDKDKIYDSAINVRELLRARNSARIPKVFKVVKEPW